jgi:putative ABC transport system permease protein
VELDFENQTQDIILVAADGNLNGFMDFHTGKQSLSMPGLGEALLSVGAAEKLGVSVGDTITLRNPDMKSLTLTVSGVYDNNVYNYAIVTPQTIQSQWGEAPELQMAFITVKDSQDVYYAGTRIGQYEGVMNVTINNELAQQVGSMLEALDLVVVTIVICAGMLAVTVLYNLTNINITERIREIATIKVLGFNSAESAAYVFKENLLLSAMGSVIGLFFGQLLLEFVMDKIKIDMVWFQARLVPMSYVWAIVLTMLSACMVDFLLYFKLEKINMAEALKSVE